MKTGSVAISVESGDDIVPVWFGKLGGKTVSPFGREERVELGDGDSGVVHLRDGNDSSDEGWEGVDVKGGVRQ